LKTKNNRIDKIAYNLYCNFEIDKFKLDKIADNRLGDIVCGVVNIDYFTKYKKSDDISIFYKKANVILRKENIKKICSKSEIK
jgi:hypothetical protein